MASEDYFAATVRHADDAGWLLSEGRPDNAAYLAGYTVECGLKVLIEAYAPELKKPWIHDLDKLELLALVATVGHVDVDRIFPSMEVAQVRDAGWDVSWRYVADGTVPEPDVEVVVRAAERFVAKTICGAVLDGRVTL